MSANTATAVLPAAAASFMQPAAGALPANYVESDPAQCGQAKVAHLLGLFGIVGTGIFNIVKRSDAGPFVRDQMKEAFNFHAFVFVAAIVLSVVGVVSAAIIGILGLLVSLANLALMIGAIVLAITNAMKAGKGQVVRYPARLSILK